MLKYLLAFLFLLSSAAALCPPCGDDEALAEAAAEEVLGGRVAKGLGNYSIRQYKD